ncbi:MAG: sugar transferase, partial [Pirellula sp.]|nr:sugar transferase [Pirellula sp.]
LYYSVSVKSQKVVYKLRTMSNNAEQTKYLLEDLNERDGPAFKIQNDPRVTSIGKFLRATGIDELPQLINVLKGEMAIVGPRPLPVAEDEECSTWQQRRLDTKPGITCLWQISKSRKMTFDEWMRLDLQYLKKRSPIYDASLILRTIKAVFMGRVGH